MKALWAEWEWEWGCAAGAGSEGLLTQNRQLQWSCLMHCDLEVDDMLGALGRIGLHR